MNTIFFNHPISEEEAREVLYIAHIEGHLKENNPETATRWFHIEIPEDKLPALKTALLISNMYIGTAARSYIDIFRR